MSGPQGVTGGHRGEGERDEPLVHRQLQLSDRAGRARLAGFEQRRVIYSERYHCDKESQSAHLHTIWKRDLIGRAVTATRRTVEHCSRDKCQLIYANKAATGRRGQRRAHGRQGRQAARPCQRFRQNSGQLDRNKSLALTLDGRFAIFYLLFGLHSGLAILHIRKLQIAIIIIRQAGQAGARTLHCLHGCGIHSLQLACHLFDGFAPST